jgi:DNA-directed RNA polymerase specialized sigma24 family protein
MKSVDKDCIRPADHASAQDFCRVFSDNLDGLYQFSLLVTGDRESAEQCFVAGLEDSIKGTNVFRDWAHSWAKRVIVKNAIRALQPRPRPERSSPSTEGSATPRVRNAHFSLESMLALGDFERLVFVLSLLEQYSDKECALLLSCRIREIRNARSQALEELMESIDTKSIADVLAVNAPEHEPQGKQAHLFPAGNSRQLPEGNVA